MEAIVIIILIVVVLVGASQDGKTRKQVRKSGTTRRSARQDWDKRTWK